MDEKKGKSNTLLATILLTLMFVPSATASPPTVTASLGKGLLETCKAGQLVGESEARTGSYIGSTTAVTYAMSCAGYIHGSYEGRLSMALDTYRQSTANLNRALSAKEITAVEALAGFCVPDGVKPIQLVQAVVEYLDQHPEHLDRASAHLIPEALGIAFPCK